MKYEDIIDLEFEPKNHPRMRIENRSAQFAPFSALTGFKEEIIEKGRGVDNKRELIDEEKEMINNQLNWLKNNLDKKIKITYFEQDQKKHGGKYLTIDGYVKKIDLVKQELIIEKKKITFDNLLQIDI